MYSVGRREADVEVVDRVIGMMRNVWTESPGVA